eukprot:UN06664
MRSNALVSSFHRSLNCFSHPSRFNVTFPFCFDTRNFPIDFGLRVVRTTISPR